MDLVLNRRQFTSDGIFGDIYSDTGVHLFVSLEHAYLDFGTTGAYIAKVPAGQYVCKRGMHRLEGMSYDFETFEITDVPGHSNILFHVGNYNRDSMGCILLGSTIGPKMILQSQKAFDEFMNLQNDVDEFIIIIKDME